MEYKYYLPNEKGDVSEANTSVNSIFIVGANGTGKSRLGAWLDMQNENLYYRIGGQRNLNFNENIELKPYPIAENRLIYGNETEKSKTIKWGCETDKWVLVMANDFNDLLSNILAKNHTEIEKYYYECKKAEKEGLNKPNCSKTIIDKLIEIWNKIFSQRELKYEDGKFIAIHNRRRYPAKNMSDGERAVLYLIAQVLCVPKDRKIIIDEPEIHLHPSILYKMWELLEEYRPDCLFIYITHDMSFVSTHKLSDKIWIKEFNGNNKWALQIIKDPELPEELLFEILGSRQKVLFVEGERNSYDYQLYSIIFQNYYIIPCSGCEEVKNRTKSFRKIRDLYQYKYDIFGLIDRDYRSDKEIENDKNDFIYTIDVAEVENLFIVEDIVKYIAEKLGKDIDEIASQVKKFIIETKFKNMYNNLICENVVSEIKYRLKTFDVKAKDIEEIKSNFNNCTTSIDFDGIASENIIKYNTILEKNDYNEVLKVFNSKELLSSIGHCFGIINKEFPNTVINLLKKEDNIKIRELFKNYLPSELWI